jgi:Dynamin family
MPSDTKVTSVSTAQTDNGEPKFPNTSSLDELQNEQRKILDLVDNLRRRGLSSVLSLPQIAVVGDQSSGKSSVLEAITQIPFPQKPNLCTRFATEIIMRRELYESITCKIIPDSSRPESEQTALRNFSRKMVDFSELPNLIDEATEKMGLGHGAAFSRDVLSIEISGPGRAQL